MGVAMAKVNLPNLDVKYNPDGSARYYYRRRWRDGNGKRKAQLLRIQGQPLSPEFMARYNDLRAQDEKDADEPPKRRHAPYTFSALIAEYRASPRWAKLAPKTRHEYEKLLNYIDSVVGGKDVRQFTRGRIIRMRDANSHRPRVADLLVVLMAQLFRRARDLEWRVDNPAEKIERIYVTQRGFPPWPPEVVEKALAAADPATAMAIHLGLAVGPRPQDTIRLRWDQYDGEAIEYTQTKTGAEVWCPLLPNMIALLDAERRRRPFGTMVANDRGEPLTGSAMSQRLRKLMRRIDCPGYSLHGLRKNATMELAQAGCDDGQIQAITGHSTLEMVKLYSRGARQKARAREAIAKLRRNTL